MTYPIGSLQEYPLCSLTINPIEYNTISPIEYNTIEYNYKFSETSIQEIYNEIIRNQGLSPVVINTRDDMADIYPYQVYAMGEWGNKWGGNQIVEIEYEEEEDVITFDEKVARELLDEIIGG